MSIQAYSVNWNPRTPLVDNSGIPTTSYGRQLLLGLYNRTGAGNGIIPQVSGLLTATGTNQGSAYAVTDDWNWFGSVPSGSGAIILPLKPGNTIQFYNGDPANALLIYPPSGAQINALGVNQPYSLAISTRIAFECWSLSQFFT
jgi:hypothetical protein